MSDAVQLKSHRKPKTIIKISRDNERNKTFEKRDEKPMFFDQQTQYVYVVCIMKLKMCVCLCDGMVFKCVCVCVERSNDMNARINGFVFK